MDPYFDYEQKRKQEQMKTIMNIPVTQFEFSVRSRNCLEKMGIETLGDLTKVSEVELLSSKPKTSRGSPSTSTFETLEFPLDCL